MPLAVVRVLAFLVLLVPALAAAAQHDLPNRRVLLLYSHEPEMDSYDPLDRGIRSALEADKAFVLEFFTEHLDLLRFSTKQQGEALLAYLHSKYQGRAIDLIIVVSPPAFEFISEHGDQLFPGVPIVFTSINSTRVANVKLKPNVTGVGIRREFGDTIDLALRLQPQTREIVIPVGSSALEKTWTEEARAVLKPYESRVALTYVEGLSMEEMLIRLSKLPSNAVVLFTPLFYTDAAGQYFLHGRALELMSGASSVPIYGTNDTFLGSGIIGGAVTDMSAIGAAAGRVGRRILFGTRPAQIPVETLNPNIHMFDARQLARFGISRSDLPTGSVVMFEQPTAWTQYKGYIVGFGALVAVQFVLISMLVLYTRRLKQSEGRLNGLSRHLQFLTRGLLLAREEERTRIAREIHDVLGQALTALKMDVAWIGRRLPSGSSEERDKLTSMETFIDETVVSVRQLATELRPGILDELGLAAAAEWQSREFESRTGIRCGFETAIGEKAIDPLVSTALFRILQESLTNVARHSRANRVDVRLEQRGAELVLEVRDDGVGITSVEAANVRALGLAGMRERARVVGGRFSITGVSGAGTTVLVQVAEPRGAEA
jgi:signal transduction histidine kinase